MKTVRTSATHPLIIDAVSAPTGGGQIGMTFCPGKIDLIEAAADARPALARSGAGRARS